MLSCNNQAPGTEDLSLLVGGCIMQYAAPYNEENTTHIFSGLADIDNSYIRVFSGIVRQCTACYSSLFVHGRQLLVVLCRTIS